MTDMVRNRVEPTRAPRGNNLATIVPNRADLSKLVHANRDFWCSDEVPAWIRTLRNRARRDLVAIANSYTRSYLAGGLIPTSELSEDNLWIAGGHQPELFHPGVWFKNVLIDRIAKEISGNGLHAIIDHDLARATSLRVPARDSKHKLAHASTIPLPLVRPASTDPLLPWNAWSIDPSRIPNACHAIEQALRSVGITQSMARDYFDEFGALSSHTNAAIAFSRVRHQMECRHGIGNWEFPMSDLCRSEAWLSFVEYCISNAAELNQTYNTCLDEYRSREGIRNPTQPVPRLGRQGEWIELPFWIRLPGQYGRHRMWVSRVSSRNCIAPEPTFDRPTHAWEENSLDPSWLVWPRALTTTLFLRVFIADLFVHGIGGGQYDRLTDAIIEQFLHITPPKYVTCTATLWLPFPDWNIAAEQQLLEESAKLERERQLLRSAPEQALDLKDPDQQKLAEEHRQLLARIPPRGDRKHWHREMAGLKTKITSAIDLPHRNWADRKVAFESKALEHKILQSREFSYVLFEERDILERLVKLSQC